MSWLRPVSSRSPSRPMAAASRPGPRQGGRCCPPPTAPPCSGPVPSSGVSRHRQSARYVNRVKRSTSLLIQHFTHTSINYSSRLARHVLADTGMKTLPITYIFWCPQYTIHRINLLNALRSMVLGFDNFSTKHKLDAVLNGSNLPESHGIFIAHHLQTFIAHSHRLNTHR